MNSADIAVREAAPQEWALWEDTHISIGVGGLSRDTLGRINDFGTRSFGSPRTTGRTTASATLAVGLARMQTMNETSTSPASGGLPDDGAASVEAVARLHEQRRVLGVRIARLSDDMAALIAASRDSNADDEHDPEGQTIAYERSQLSAVTSQALEHLTEVDAAIERVANGRYGVCEICGKPINEARLEARPTARTCVQHVPARS